MGITFYKHYRNYSLCGIMVSTLDFSVIGSWFESHTIHIFFSFLLFHYWNRNFMVVKIKKKSVEDLLYCFFISAQNSPRLPKRFLQVFIVFVLLEVLRDPNHTFQGKLPSRSPVLSARFLSATDNCRTWSYKYRLIHVLHRTTLKSYQFNTYFVNRHNFWLVSIDIINPFQFYDPYR